MLPAVVMFQLTVKTINAFWIPYPNFSKTIPAYENFLIVLLSCHVHVSECIHSLQLPECQGTPYSKQARYLNFTWLKRDSNPQPLSSYTNTQPFSETGQFNGYQILGIEDQDSDQ